MQRETGIASCCDPSITVCQWARYPSKNTLRTTLILTPTINVILGHAASADNGATKAIVQQP